MKTLELQGALLDYWVAKAGEEWRQAHLLFPTMTLDPTFRGVEMFTFEGGRMVCRLVPNNPFRQDYQIFSPSTKWQIAGLIIERERITTVAWKRDRWGAFVGDQDPYLDVRADWDEDATGPTPLIAAMRAFVAHKFGDEVPDTIEGTT